MAQMVKMVAKQRHQYAGRELSVGEHFECEEKHAPVLIALARAEFATRDIQAAPADEYRTREMMPDRQRGRPRRGA